MASDIDIRLVQEDEVDELRALLGIAYLEDAPEEVGERFRILNERDRTFVAVDGTEIVGSASAYSFDLTVPGARKLPMAGTTIVAVKPTHRRRGILRRLMAAHFEDITARNEPLAGLWASEAAIYGRFGYGEATAFTDVKIDTDGIALTGQLDPSVTVRMVDRDTFLSVAPDIYEQFRLNEPGNINRSKEWWDLRVANDSEAMRQGASAYRYLVAYRDNKPVGSTHYRTKDNWGQDDPGGEIKASTVMATDFDAELAIWNLLFSIDLTTKLQTYNRPMDDPLLLRLNDSRKYKRKVADALYLRLHDVAAALAGRTYSADGELVIGVTDGDTAGSYRLASTNGEGSCERVDAEADVHMEARTLGSIYLGGTRAISMARAGRITGSSDAAERLDAMFQTDRPPNIHDGF